MTDTPTELQVLQAAQSPLTDAERILLWLQLAELSKNRSNSARYLHYMGMIWDKIWKGIGT